MGTILLKKPRLLRIWRKVRGQDLIEYALMAGFVAVAAGSIMPTVSTNISVVFSKIRSTTSNYLALGWAMDSRSHSGVVASLRSTRGPPLSGAAAPRSSGESSSPFPHTHLTPSRPSQTRLIGRRCPEAGSSPHWHLCFASPQSRWHGWGFA